MTFGGIFFAGLALRSFLQGKALRSSIIPNPFFIRRGFDLNPKPLSPLQGRGLTRKIAETADFPPFWYRGTRDVFFIGYRLEQSIEYWERIPCAQPPLPFQGRGWGRGVENYGEPRRGKGLRAIPKP